ncbi:MAG: cyclase family protein [Pirellulales bacterium]|nr:cyclase family protein [Pirellulales bacterium]
MPRLIDLSHPLVDGQLGFPDDPGIQITVHGTIASLGYNLTKISMSSHQGTHLDAPLHFFDDGNSIDQIPLDRFYGPAWLVDLAPGTLLPPRTPITVEMLRPHEARFQPGGKVVYRTGWQQAFNTPAYFTDYPTLTLEAAEWIARRRIGLLGMDTPTPSTEWQACHHILLGPGVEIVLVEALANLDELPEQFTLIGFPLNLQGRDGSPIRAVAVVK